LSKAVKKSCQKVVKKLSTNVKTLSKSCQKVVKKFKIGCQKISILKRVGGEEQEQEGD
jgi:hypothetical protein